MEGSEKGDSVDIAIIGAGAAGIGAGRRLQALAPHLSIRMLEAGDRIGGRAWTVKPPALAGEPVDLGCGWLHGATTNAWTAIAEATGLTVDRTPAPWSEGGRNLESRDAEERRAGAAVDAFFARVEQRGEREPDASLAQMLEPGNPWNGRIEAIGTYVNGVELAQASIIDYNRYEPGPPPDWRVREGYGTLVTAFGRPIPASLRTRVVGINHRNRDHVEVLTDRGTIRARFVIVTISTTMLANETIRFDPALPEKAEAASKLPLGLANKLFLRSRSPESLPSDTRVSGSHDRWDTGSYQIRAFGADVVEGYFGGELAHDLERAGPQAAFAFALDELAAHLGSGIRTSLDLVTMSAWAGAPFVGGSYSYARPGASDLRAVLAEPVDGRLFFAGEACSHARFSTAHGAYESGVEAAERIVASRGFAANS